MMDPGKAAPGGTAPPPGKPPAVPPGIASCAPYSFIVKGVADFLQLLLPVFTFFLLRSLVLSKPVGDFITLVKSLLFVLIIDLALKFFVFNSCFHVECTGLKQILGRVKLFKVFPSRASLQPNRISGADMTIRILEAERTQVQRGYKRDLQVTEQSESPQRNTA